eukprot:scaffold154321_cov33-Tisochrysis_lutea.AAC.1
MSANGSNGLRAMSSARYARPAVDLGWGGPLGSDEQARLSRRRNTDRTSIDALVERAMRARGSKETDSSVHTSASSAKVERQSDASDAALSTCPSAAHARTTEGKPAATRVRIPRFFTLHPTRNSSSSKSSTSRACSEGAAIMHSFATVSSLAACFGRSPHKTSASTAAATSSRTTSGATPALPYMLGEGGELSPLKAASAWSFCSVFIDPRIVLSIIGRRVALTTSADECLRSAMTARNASARTLRCSSSWSSTSSAAILLSEREGPSAAARAGSCMHMQQRTSSSVS